MLKKCYCATCIGIDAVVTVVEVNLTVGVGIHLVGLPDNAVRESLLRVVTALSSYGFKIPGRKLVVNLAPADIRKEGSGYDLAIAIAILSVSEQIKGMDTDGFVLLGELALDGNLRPVKGALPIAVQARDSGFKACILPPESAGEAADIDGIKIYGAANLAQVIEIMCHEPQAEAYLLHPGDGVQSQSPCYSQDFSQVKGQTLARRGLEIAAAGGHSCLLTGAPGSGKSMMAACLPSILPPMTREESIQTSKIYSVTGEGCRGGLMRERPFRTPHHSASLVSLIGGGSSAMPGEISLAHNGVLYLDEVPQFSRAVLDALRQPIEDGRVTISRAKYKVIYPCSFMLIASMNPCPCGFYGDGTDRCHCTRVAIDRYLERLSGPFLDRIDLQIFVSPLETGQLLDDSSSEPSSAIASRVMAARKIQLRRFKDEGIFTNSQMDAAMIQKYCSIGEREKEFLGNVIDKLNLSARAYGRILKLARTIADLNGNNLLTLQDISEAVQFRNLDRRKIND